MKIQKTNCNFCATLKRTALKGKAISKQDMLKTYDEAISDIKSKKQAALEVDSYMKSPEIKELLEKLPADDTLEIYNSYAPEFFQDEKGKVQAYNFNYLNFCPQAQSSINIAKNLRPKDTMDYNFVLELTQNTDGTLNKASIKGWLESLVKLFGRN